MKRLLVVLLFSAIASSLFGRDLTVEQALTLARDHSFDLKKAGAEREAATGLLRSARAERLPTLSATGLAYYIDEVPTLDIELPAGPSFSREVGTQENYQTDLRLTLPVYTGGRISSGVETASASLAYRTALEEASLDRLLLQVRLTYLELIKADRMIDVATSSVERSEIIWNDVTSMHAAGVVDSTDILEARLALTRARFVRVRAQSHRRSVELQLATLLGLDPEEPLRLTSEFPDPRLPGNILLDVSDRPELRATEAGIRISESRVKADRASRFPTVAVYAGYSYGKPNLDRFNNTWNDYTTVGASMTWSLNVFKKRATGAAFRLQLDAARHAASLTHEHLDRDARLALEQLKLTFHKYTTASEEHRITSDNYRLAQQQFREGSLPSNRLLEIETTLGSAQANLAAGRVDFHAALARYQYSTGSESPPEDR